MYVRLASMSSSATTISLGFALLRMAYAVCNAATELMRDVIFPWTCFTWRSTRKSFVSNHLAEPVPHLQVWMSSGGQIMDSLPFLWMHDDACLGKSPEAWLALCHRRALLMQARQHQGAPDKEHTKRRERGRHRVPVGPLWSSLANCGRREV